MIDFLLISTKLTNRGVMEVYPKFIIDKSRDLMIRGGDFYAIWLEEKGIWSTDEQDAIKTIDRELDKYVEEHKERLGNNVKVLHMWDAESGMIDRWHKYCQKQMRDSFHVLDEKLIFSNFESNKKDYASKRLSYPLEEGSTEAYDKLMSTLYSEEERHKIEWAIGSIVSGDSKKIQKFLVLYGAAGTGKSTVLNIIQKLFEGYYSVFDAKSLGSSNAQFALEAFKSNPLVAIQHDGDLSRIEDNTRLNSLVSHETMTVNAKFEKLYSTRFNCFLFMGTNKPVKITDAKSGLIRRLIDVSPSGNKLSASEYKQTVKQVNFELGAIAKHCLDVYLENPSAYDDYIPVAMLGASNDFYNFVEDSYMIFKKEDGVTLKQAWEMYKTYCADANVSYPFSQRIFKEELKNYFYEFHDRVTLDDGTRLRSFYEGFRTDRFEVTEVKRKKPVVKVNSSIIFKEQPSIFDMMCAECHAQYASAKEVPQKKWSDIRTCLKDLDTSKLHYVKVPKEHIVIDFDICDENGNKSFEKNLEEAAKWPPTYAELSKSGEGIHLHYIYTGDVTKLKREYGDHIEIKVFNGNSSLRRKLTKCNDIPIATISSGLPTKGDKMVSNTTIKNEKGLRSMIERNLQKEFHPGTKPSIDFIFTILEDAYDSGMKYDVSDMRRDILTFAQNSTHQAEYCMKLANKMKYKSENFEADKVESEDPKLIFYDVEVFPNLFLINWKPEGEGVPVTRMINPKPSDIEMLIKRKLVGFNCRRYDNHILYGCLMGYNNEQLYNLSQRIISGDRNAFFGEAYNLSYTDVYDFAAKKQSLKKWEIELGIHHQELGLPWDQPVPEKLWVKVAEYCDNDVIATEAVFNELKADFLAREILADIAGMTVNDTTNSLTTRIIFGKERKPQKTFNYRHMGEMPNDNMYSAILDPKRIFKKGDTISLGNYKEGDFTVFDGNAKAHQIAPIFPGYSFDRGVSTYRGEEVGEGGYVYAEPGMYGNVALLDIASMHPHSIIAEQLFGSYTDIFKQIVDARVAIKHGEFDYAKTLLDGKLAPYLKDESAAGDLAQALKIAINSVYGLTSATFENPFRDPRNKDNIVAKRGALFMVNLKHEVQKRGFTVAHIKTDSIKIPDATPEIISFVQAYGELYGYTFEHEATYDRMCLVNDAVYIAKYKDDKECKKMYGYIPEKNAKKPNKWTATGTQFAVPYVFKTLFTKEPIEFNDLCETKSVKSELYLDFNEDLPDVTELEKKLTKLEHDYKKGLISDMTFEPEAAALVDEIAKGHHYEFVGRVGQFCPIKDGCGGAELVRTQGNKYYAVTGTKGFRWMESEMVKNLNKEDCINLDYYEQLAHDAMGVIIFYGDYQWFISDDPYVPPGYIDGHPEYAQEYEY